MKVLIKYHEKTDNKDQSFILDLSKHKKVEVLNNNYLVDLSKYDGKIIYGKFINYSRIDGSSYFEIDTLQVDRDLKIDKILNG